eukprot:gene3234-biopygen20995
MSAQLGLGGEETQRKFNEGVMMTLHLVERQGSRHLPWRALLDALNLEEEHPLEGADHNVKSIRRVTSFDRGGPCQFILDRGRFDRLRYISAVEMSAPFGLGVEETQRKFNKGMTMTLHLVGRQGSKHHPWRALLDALNLEEKHHLEGADHNVKAIRRATPHPAELMGSSMACTDLSSLDQAITEHGRSFNDRHVSAAMSRGLSQTLRTVANLGIEDKAFIAAWLHEAKLELHEFNAQNLSNTVSAVAKLGIEDKAFIAAWLREAKLKLHDCNAQGLSNTLYAAVNLGIEDKAFIAAWLRVAKLKLQDDRPEPVHHFGLSNTLSAAADIGIQDEAFFAAWLREAKLKLHDFNAQELSNSLWAAAKLGIEDKTFIAAWLHVAKLNLHDFNALDMSQTLRAAAKLGIEDDAFIAAWLREAKLKLHNFNA